MRLVQKYGAVRGRSKFYDFRVKTKGKLCIVIHNTLGKGDAALSRFIPLADGLAAGTQSVPTFLNHQNVSPFYHSKWEPTALPLQPHQARLGRIASPSCTKLMQKRMIV